MKVPTVTADDLAAFHARVYGRPAPPQSLPYHSGLNDQTVKRKRSEDDPSELLNGPDILGDGDTPHDEDLDDTKWGLAEEDVEEDDEDDGLGYYPDGVKRTLTDDQIAMFRHSELYAIQRRREVAKENREVNGEEVGDDGEDGKINEESATEHDDESGISPIITSNEVTQETQTFQHRDQGPPKSMPYPNQKPQNRATSRNQKRKRKRLLTDSDSADEINSERKSRAQIRELDAATAEGQALDYDDGELDYGGDADPPPTAKAVEVPELDTRREGRKIWWPVLAG